MQPSTKEDGEVASQLQVHALLVQHVRLWTILYLSRRSLSPDRSPASMSPLRSPHTGAGQPPIPPASHLSPARRFLTPLVP